MRANIVDGDDVRMIQRTGRMRLKGESLMQIFIRVWRKNLDCHVAGQARIGGRGILAPCRRHPVSP